MLSGDIFFFGLVGGGEEVCLRAVPGYASWLMWYHRESKESLLITSQSEEGQLRAAL